MILVDGVSAYSRQAVHREISPVRPWAGCLREAQPLMYDAERLIHPLSNIRTTVCNAGARCHSPLIVLAALTRRLGAMAEMHASASSFRRTKKPSLFLSKRRRFPPEWDAWSLSVHCQSGGLRGVRPPPPGHGTYYGEMQVDATPDGGHNRSFDLGCRRLTFIEPATGVVLRRIRLARTLAGAPRSTATERTTP